MSEISTPAISSAQDSPFGTELELAQLAARGGHDEETALRLFRRLRGPKEALRGQDSTALRDHLVLTHAPLVEHCARGFLASGEPLEDLIQEGYVGLIKAVDRFNPDQGIKFSTYSCHFIAGEIRHYLRDLGKLIHEPGWHAELRQKIARANEALAQTTGKTPSPEDIAAHLEIKVETVREVLTRSQTLHVDSLDAPREGGDGEAQLSVLERHEALKGGERRSDESRVDDQLFLEGALPQLKMLEQQALALFFFEELSKTEIARRLDLSVNYASHLIKRGMENLRRILETSQPAIAGHGAASELPQQGARAAYLLELARGGAQSDPRRTFKPTTRVAALSRPVIASLSQFAVLVDEESARTLRYGGEFSVLWCQIENWAALTQKMTAAEKRAASAVATALVRKTSRDIDKIAVFPNADPVGLHFLVLLPATGAPGASLGRRLTAGFEALEIPLGELGLEVKIAYATFPTDGKSTEEVFAVLGRKLGGI